MTRRAARKRPGAAPQDPGGDRPRQVLGTDTGHRTPTVALWLSVLAAALVVAALVPPLSTQARRVEALEALQFALLALAAPALVALGAPWRRLGLASGRRPVTDAEGTAVLDRPRIADRVAAARRRHPDLARSLAYLVVDAAAVVAWRTPAAVDALARHPWLSPVEALTLVVGGIGLWLELVESPPFAPRLARPKRIAVAAVAMWVIWVTAYLVGLAHGSVYGAYPHVPGRDLSVSADQAVTTGTLWFASLCAFVPVVFTNLVLWLRSDEDPDDALYRLVRDGRRTTGSPPSGLRDDGRRPFG